MDEHPECRHRPAFKILLRSHLQISEDVLERIINYLPENRRFARLMLKEDNLAGVKLALGFKYIIGQQPFKIIESIQYQALQTDSVNCFKYGCELDNKPVREIIIEETAKHGSVKCLRYLHTVRGISCTQSQMCFAATFGQLAYLQCMVEEIGFRDWDIVDLILMSAATKMPPNSHNYSSPVPIFPNIRNNKECLKYLINQSDYVRNP